MLDLSVSDGGVSCLSTTAPLPRRVAAVPEGLTRSRFLRNSARAGPFLRLANGDGWVFKKMRGIVLMRREAGAYTGPLFGST
jgi:hypothetical protein